MPLKEVDMTCSYLRWVIYTLVLLSFSETTAWAGDEVSGTLTRTYVIVEDTDLVGDVTCDVGSNPCFSFGASGVELRLNGFTITGKADPVTGCGGDAFSNEFGITTNGQHSVGVRGPGVVQRFRNYGVVVSGGSRNARIEGLTASTNCTAGIRVMVAAFDTLVEGNTVVRNGAASPGSPCGGIWLNGQNSRVRLNNAHGNGYANPPDDFGIGVIDGGHDNHIEENTISGNTNGLYITAGARNTLVRNNVIVGNPAIQVGSAQPDARALDIVNLAAPGETKFERNVCLTAVNAPCPVVVRH
jgi:parallel beta-helix repeat protein